MVLCLPDILHQQTIFTAPYCAVIGQRSNDSCRLILRDPHSFLKEIMGFLLFGFHLNLIYQ